MPKGLADSKLSWAVVIRAFARWECGVTTTPMDAQAYQPVSNGAPHNAGLRKLCLPVALVGGGGGAWAAHAAVASISAADDGASGVVVGVVLALVALVLCIVSARLARGLWYLAGPAHNSPAVVLRRMAMGEVTRPVLACVGDSITHGVASSDWVGMVRHGVKGQFEVVNAGINSECTENMLARIGDVVALKPAVVVLMVGTNDVKGIHEPKWGRQSTTDLKLRHVLSFEVYQQHLEGIITALKAIAPPARIALCSLPPMGEGLNEEQNSALATVQKANEVVKSVADSNGVHFMDVNTALTLELQRASIADPKPVELFTRKMIPAIVRHWIFGESWDSIGERYGMHLMSDGLHLNDKAGHIVADLAVSWILE